MQGGKLHYLITSSENYACRYISQNEDCFYNCSERNNVVVLLGTLKVQSFILTKVSDCGLLIVVTSSSFLKRKNMLTGKRQLAQMIKIRSPAYI